MNQTSKTSFACKAMNLDEVREQTAQQDPEDAVSYVVRAEMLVSAGEYDSFTRNLSKTCAWFETFRGGREAGNRERVVVMLIAAPGRPTLLVNPEGYDYARYVAFA